MKPTLREAAVATLRHLSERDSVRHSFPSSHPHIMNHEVLKNTSSVDERLLGNENYCGCKFPMRLKFIGGS